MAYPMIPEQLIGNLCLPHSSAVSPLYKSSMHRWINLFLDSPTYLYAFFSLSKLYNIILYLKSKPFTCSSSWSEWATFKNFCFSIKIVPSTCQVTNLNKLVGFSMVLHWIYRFIWEKLTTLNTDSLNPSIYISFIWFFLSVSIKFYQLSCRNLAHLL